MDFTIVWGRMEGWGKGRTTREAGRQGKSEDGGKDGGIDMRWARRGGKEWRMEGRTEGGRRVGAVTKDEPRRRVGRGEEAGRVLSI